LSSERIGLICNARLDLVGGFAVLFDSRLYFRTQVFI